MGMIDFDKFLASFITAMKECSRMRTFSIPVCIKKALEEQGLEYKDGEIVKSQRRVSAEAKEAGYDESEGERIRKHLIDCVTRTIPEADAFKEISKEQILDWLEKQGSEPNWCHHKVDLSNCSEEYRKAYYDGWNNCICNILNVLGLKPTMKILRLRLTP